MRPRGTVGSLRQVLRDATLRLVLEHGLQGVTWPQAVQAAGLQLGRTERDRARRTMDNMARAGELERRGSMPSAGRPLTLYAPSQPGPERGAAALDAVLRSWSTNTAA